MSDELYRPYQLPPYILQVMTMEGVDAKRFMEAIDSVRADALERGRWIPVSERLPDERWRVLLRSGGTAFVGSLVRYTDTTPGYYWHIVNEFRLPFDDVTHWMPLPNPPETPGKRG